jgi:signal transduction histidine kinase
MMAEPADQPARIDRPAGRDPSDAAVHELSNSVTAIIGYLEQLTLEAKGPLNDEQRRLVTRISRNAVRAERSLLELRARVEAAGGRGGPAT